QLVAGAGAAKEEGGVVELERQEAAIGVVAMESGGADLGGTGAVRPPPDQRAQMVLQHFLELGRVGKRPGCRARVAALLVDEPLPKERVGPLLLVEPLAGGIRVAEADCRLGSFTVH